MRWGGTTVPRSARDRDRLRQMVLEEHGWRIHRIWSTDWFQRPAEQLDVLVRRIEAAKNEFDEQQADQAMADRLEAERVRIEREEQPVELGEGEAFEAYP